MARALVVAALALAGCAYDAPPLVVGDADVDAPPDAMPDAGPSCPDACPGVCVDDVCVNDSAVRFVAVAGDDSSDCERTSPCHTIARAREAAGAAEAIVAMFPGSYSEGLVVTGALTLVALGDVSLTGNNDVLSVQSGATLVLEGVTVEANRGTGVKCTGPATVTIRGGGINGAQRHAVDGRDCVVSLTAARIDKSSLQGLELVRGSLTIRRSVLTANQRGGARLRDGDAIEVSGSVFAFNGEPTTVSTGSPFGAADLRATTVRFVGNTLVDNRAASNADAAFVCDNNATGATLENTLFVSRFAYNVTCPFSRSAFFGTNNYPRDTNLALDQDPLVGEAVGDFHLRLPLPSTAQPPPPGELDLDGEPRPLGVLDIGADERP